MKTNIINNYNDTDYSDVINKVCKTSKNILQLANKSLTIVLVDNKAIREMNNTFRKIDTATDVLTFPDGYLNNLGDVIISMEKCEEQANDLEHSFNRELGFLVVHGLLHTLGYDHQEEQEENEMNELQNRILNKSKLYR